LVFLVQAGVFSATAQTSVPLSVCEVMKHPKKYNGKEILIRGVYEVGAETSPLEPDEECSDYEAITAGPDKDFDGDNDPKMVEKFNQATDLMSAVPLRSNGYKNLFCCAMRMNITAHGLLQYSHKKKYGHLNGYRIAFLIRRIEDITDARMLLLGSKEYYSDR
jgi:hypothetical protein